MTVLSRAFFINAKRGQMEDFFGNLVWAVHSGPEREKVSVFKVRGLLKWSTEKRWFRSCARLVQGFNDPDALAGRIGTTSPATPR